MSISIVSNLNSQSRSQKWNPIFSANVGDVTILEQLFSMIT